MKYFIIVVENGEYSDYSMTNLFLVETEARAEQLVKALNEAHQFYWNFQRNELEQFRKEYQEKDPEPAHVEIERVRPLLPVAPSHLRGLPKNERKLYPEYQTFLKDLKAYNRWVEAARIEDREHYNTWKIARDQWLERYALALKPFREEKLLLPMRNLFPSEYQHLAEHAEITNYGPSFSWDTIEVI